MCATEAETAKILCEAGVVVVVVLCVAVTVVLSEAGVAVALCTALALVSSQVMNYSLRS